MRDNNIFDISTSFPILVFMFVPTFSAGEFFRLSVILGRNHVRYIRVVSGCRIFQDGVEAPLGAVVSRFSAAVG